MGWEVLQCSGWQRLRKTGQTTEVRARTGYRQSGSGQPSTHLPFLVEQPPPLSPSHVSLLLAHIVVSVLTQAFASPVPSTQNTPLFSSTNSYSSLRAQTEIHLDINSMISGVWGTG